VLQSIRDRAQGWLAGVIVFLICIPFALWGIQEYFGGGPSLIVAEVNGAEIGTAAYRQAYQNYRQRLEQLMGEQLDISKLNQERLKLDALNYLVDSELLRQTAYSAGMRIGDQQLAAAIQAFPAFQVDGKFSTSRYQETLQLMGMSPAGFEEQLRRDLLNEQLRQGIQRSAFITDMEKERIERLRYQTRDVRYLTLPAEPLLDTLEIPEQEVSDYYERNIESFTEPERVRIAYIDLRLEDLAKQIHIDEQILGEEYEARIGNYRVPEQRDAHHILIAVDQVATEEEEAEAKERAEALLARVEGGEEFTELAKEYSDDLASRADGGATGAIKRGEMEPQFEEAIFSMTEGELKIARTSFGFHIIRLNQIMPEHIRSFDEVAEELEADLQTEKARDLLYEQVDNIANAAYENSKNLEVAAEIAGLEIETAGPFSRTGDSDIDETMKSLLDTLGVDESEAAVDTGNKIFDEPKVVAAAFSPGVLEEGNNSDIIELGDDRVVVLRVTERIAATPRPLDEVREEIIDTLRLRRATEQTRGQGEALLVRLREGEAADQIAAAAETSWETAEAVSRTGAGLSRAVLRHVFGMPHPDDDGPVFDGLSVGGGDYVLVALDAVHDGEPDGAEEEAKGGAQNREAEAVSRWEWLDYVAEIKESADIELFTDAL
jgi:peptidyl-prolyl cis-trans isomerase D